jgi:3',5'-cyclic AMP phosphodiesterase CpdA
VDQTTFLHLSDLHLVAAGEAVAGADPERQLRRVLARAEQIAPLPAFCVVSGDIVDDGAEESYARARALLSPFEERGVPLLVALGNHDDRAAFRRGFLGLADGDGSPWFFGREVGGVAVSVLDSSVPGEIGGELGAEQLVWLEERLRQPAPRGHLVVVHHPSRLAGPAASPEFLLRDATALEAVVAGHRGRVLGVLSGHSHQANAAPFGGTLFATAPATLYQLEHLENGDLTPSAGAGFGLCVVGAGGLVVHPVLLPAEAD